jgi:hypothetical protein
MRTHPLPQLFVLAHEVPGELLQFLLGARLLNLLTKVKRGGFIRKFGVHIPPYQTHRTKPVPAPLQRTDCE